MKYPAVKVSEAYHQARRGLGYAAVTRSVAIPLEECVYLQRSATIHPRTDGQKFGELDAHSLTFRKSPEFNFEIRILS